MHAVLIDPIEQDVRDVELEDTTNGQDRLNEMYALVGASPLETFCIDIANHQVFCFCDGIGLMRTRRDGLPCTCFPSIHQPIVGRVLVLGQPVNGFSRPCPVKADELRQHVVFETISI